MSQLLGVSRQGYYQHVRRARTGALVKPTPGPQREWTDQTYPDLCAWGRAESMWVMSAVHHQGR